MYKYIIKRLALSILTLLIILFILLYFKGETLGIVGESGSGKSVTTKAITWMLDENGIIENSTIIYEDTDLTKLTKKRVKICSW